MRMLALLVTLTFSAHAQWAVQDAHTTADLRGIDNVGGGVAWASGTNGTVLRTEDAGFVWQLCAVPPGAEKLDFRGIQAFDNNTAIVMSTGKGDLSRLYKTTDGCQTWKLVFTNPDVDGFFDAIRMLPPLELNIDRPSVRIGRVIGDPVDGRFVEFETRDGGEHWTRLDMGQAGAPSAHDGEALFAASNSSLLLTPGGDDLFVTGGSSGARSRVLSEYVKHDPRVSWKYVGGDIPMPSKESGGAFSVALKSFGAIDANTPPNDKWTLLYIAKGVLVTVGGDYKNPDDASGTSAYSMDSGLDWQKATTPPHGYRSAVAYDAATKTWVTVGPNGTDVSTDDGRNWRALRPLAGEASDTDQHWNALSLPFVVGPKGRIGVLEMAALKAK